MTYPPPLTYTRVSLPLLWTVDEAKTHLRITDADHDADVQQKLDAAQEMICAYLGPAADPTWDTTTAPKAVKHAVFLLLTHYFEHRGDDMAPTTTGSTPDADVWKAIQNALCMYRDPSLG